ncbi:DUF4326 domain-containing protein [Nocardia wallacei]|uniref:DUF4326 domain-containing protein n=1 Tax=Nocardia wallacei TaxID=480035 RepID=UPI00245850E2|nr:DUF4326 domain-containing protein [Nocardia wallacei]
MPDTTTPDAAAATADTRPRRHQKPPRGRLRGWRKPPRSIVITRPGRWSNPYRLVEHGGAYTRSEAVDQFRRDLYAGQLVTRPGRAALGVDDARRELVGLDLVCSCALDQACHGDVLLAAANPDTDDGRKTR